MALNALTSKASSLVTDQLGSILGIGSEYPLYDKFVSAILQDANNCIPEKSHWVGFFSFDPPTDPSTDKKSLTDRLGDAAGAIGSAISGAIAGLNPFANEGENVKENLYMNPIFSGIGGNLEPHRWKGIADKSNYMANQFTSGLGTSVMFLSGVRVPGDGFGIERPTVNFNVGGFLKSPITRPRNDLPELEITFNETNTSLVDFVIRPWVIHSSYASLKFATKATFNIFNLTRSPTGFRVRKQFTFYNVVPMSIDTEDYIYQADSDVPKRQVKFVYTDYSMSGGENLIDSLFGSALNVVKGIALKAATGAVEAGVDLVAGGASRVLTNITGSITGAARAIVVDTQSRIRQSGKRAEDGILDKTAFNANKVIGVNPSSDTPTFSQINSMSTAGASGASGGAQLVTINANDRMMTNPLPIKNTTTMDNVTYTIRNANSDDTVDGNGLKLQEKGVSKVESSYNPVLLETNKDDHI